MIICVKNVQEYIEELLELINNFSKFSEHKINIQMSIALLLPMTNKGNLKLKIKDFILTLSTPK